MLKWNLEEPVNMLFTLTTVNLGDVLVGCPEEKIGSIVNEVKDCSGLSLPSLFNVIKREGCCREPEKVFKEALQFKKYCYPSHILKEKVYENETVSYINNKFAEEGVFIELEDKDEGYNAVISEVMGKIHEYIDKNEVENDKVFIYDGNDYGREVFYYNKFGVLVHFCTVLFTNLFTFDRDSYVLADSVKSTELDVTLVYDK